MIRKAEAVWTGDLKSGAGTVKVESGAFEKTYSFRTRMENEPGTNPEELLGAAHAACFSMALSAKLAEEGYPPTRLHTEARVHFGPAQGGFAISKIELVCDAAVPGINPQAFQKFAEDAKKNCPVSRALSAVDMHLNASLKD